MESLCQDTQDHQAIKLLSAFAFCVVNYVVNTQLYIYVVNTQLYVYVVNYVVNTRLYIYITKTRTALYYYLSSKYPTLTLENFLFVQGQTGIPCNQGGSARTGNMLITCC